MSEFKRIFKYASDWGSPADLASLCTRITRRNKVLDDNVLTISAQRGLVKQETYFNKRIASQDLSNYYLLSEGDFAYNKSYSKGHPFGVIRRLTEHSRGVVSPLYICFRVTDTACNQDYLYQLFLAGALDEGLSLISKEGIRAHGLINVGVKDFFDLKVCLPSKSEQTKIAEILSTVDRAIEQTGALIEKHQRIKTALMRDLLTRGVDDSGNVRSEQSHKFKDFSRERIPAEWEITTLGRVAEFLSGYAFKNRELNEFGWRVVRISNLHKPEFPFWHYKGKVRSSWIVRNGDVLFTWAGVAASIDCIRYEGPDALMNQHIYNFKFASEDIKKYVYYFLQSCLPQLRAGIEGGAGQLHLTKEKIKAIAIPLPNTSERKSIVGVLDKLEETLTVYRNQFAKTKLLKASLMQDLLTGRKLVSAILPSGQLTLN